MTANAPVVDGLGACGGTALLQPRCLLPRVEAVGTRSEHSGSECHSDGAYGDGSNDSGDSSHSGDSEDSDVFGSWETGDIEKEMNINTFHFALHTIKDGRFRIESVTLDDFMRDNAITNRWEGTGIPEDFMKCVFIAVIHQLLMMRRARILCDAYAAGHTGVLQAWEDHVRTTDVVKLIDQLRAIVVVDFAVQDAAAAEALAAQKAARTAAMVARSWWRNDAEMIGQTPRAVLPAPTKVGNRRSGSDIVLFLLLVW
jgi:hypothetical protein